MLETNTRVISKITSKNQVTIPASVRDILQVNSNDEIEWIIHPNGEVGVANAADSFWNVVKEQERKYGNVSTPEIDWGADHESEDI